MYLFIYSILILLLCATYFSYDVVHDFYANFLIIFMMVIWILSMMISWRLVSQNIRSGRLRAFAFAGL